jgi:branched-chain amino acid transport system permease protein
MGYALQQVPTILAIGSLYALAACGYTLIHAVTRQFNLALGAAYVTGGYAAFIAVTLLDILGWPLGLAMFGAVLLGGAATAAATGAALRTLSMPTALGRGNPVAPLVTTIGLWIVCAEAVRLLHRSHTLFTPSPLPGSLAIGESWALPLSQVALPPSAALALAATLWLVHRSQLGRGIRAVADDLPMAALLGVAVGRVVGYAFVLGAVLTGLAGALAVARYGAVWPHMGLVFGLKALAAAVIGGIGSLAGAIAGAFLIAAIETVWSAYLAGDYRDVAVFAVLILALVFRPDGLFMRPVADGAPGPGGTRR